MKAKIFMDRSKGCKTYKLAAIDIENNPKTGAFICAGYWDEDGGLYYDNIDDLCTKLIERDDYVLIAFNWGYDHPFISSVIDDSTLLYAGSRFISAKLVNGVQLIDTANHVDGRLEDWINYLDMGFKKETLEDLKVRVMSDVKATYILGEFLQDFYNKMNVSLKLTVSSNSMAIYKKNFLYRTFIRETNSFNAFERDAYYGGRTEIFKREDRTVYSYDINSAYLSVMKTGLFPDPMTARHHKNPKGWEKHFKSQLGIYKCKVYAPRNKVMVLPYKDEEGKLIFPCGTFTGTWTNIELERAMKRGYKILEVYEYITYKQAIPLFRPFARYIWQQREKTTSVGMNKLIKKIGNSLYGKFAQRNEVGGYYGKLEDYTGPMTAGIVPVTVDGIEYISITSTEKEESVNSFPCIPVFITAYTRIMLLERMLLHEDALVYVDTDSVKYETTDEKDKSSKELGGFDFEYEKTQAFYAPKFYGDKIKGVPARAAIYSDLNTKERFATYEKPNKYKEAIRRGIIVNKWVEITKRLSLKDTKRVWISDDISEPIEVKE